jgi:hypothetical protein
MRRACCYCGPSAEQRIADKEFNLVAFGAAISSKPTYRHAVVATILVLVAVRLACAALMPLSFD